MINRDYLELTSFFVKPCIDKLTTEAIQDILDVSQPLNLKLAIQHWREYDPDPNLSFTALVNRIDNSTSCDTENCNIENTDLKYFNNVDKFDIRQVTKYLSNNAPDFISDQKQIINDYLKELLQANIYKNNNDKMYNKLNYLFYTEMYDMYANEETAYEGIYAMIESLNTMYSKVPIHNKITLFTEFAYDLVNRKKLPLTEDKAFEAVKEFFYQQRNINEDIIEIYANKSLVYKATDSSNDAFISQADDIDDYDDDAIYEAAIGINESKKTIGKVKSPTKKESPAKAIMNFFKEGKNMTKQGLKFLLTKIYGKSDSAIIDDMPNILGLARRSLTVIGAASISLWLALPALIIDIALANKADKEKTAKLLDKVKKEQTKVKKQLEDEKRSEKNKENLKAYLKELKAQEDRINTHRSAAMAERERDAELYNTNDDLGDDDDFDFDLEEMCSDEDDIILLPIYEELRIIAEECDVDLMTMIISIGEACNDTPEVFLEKAKVVIKKTKDNMNKKSFRDKIHDKKEKAFNAMDNVKRAAYIKGKEAKTIGKLAVNKVSTGAKSLTSKEKEASRKLDDQIDIVMMKSKTMLENNKRDAIVKGSIIPSFSKCIKNGIALAGITAVNPILGVISAVGGLIASKKLNDRQRFLLLDEIEVHLKVIDEKIDKAKASGNTDALTDLYKIQVKLKRERNRINYGKRGNYIKSVEMKD